MPAIEAMMQHHHSSSLDQQTTVGPMSVVSPNQPRTQLRRAVYIHVSDLTSAYNIDHVRLEEELARVKAEFEHSSGEESSTRSSLGVPTELDTSYKKRLLPPRSGNNMVVLVGKVRIVVDKNRVDGSRVRLAEVEVGDETGTVSLRARDEQIDSLQEIADRSGAVVLRNCMLELYQGKHIRLAVTKWGKLSAYPDQVPSTPPPPSKINRERNFSMIDLSLVASEMSFSQHQQQADPQFHDIDVASQQGSASRSFQSSQSRRGRRPSSRGKSSPSPNMPVHSYPDINMPNTMRPYQRSNLQHGYTVGFIPESLGGSQYYNTSQQDSALPSAQQQQQIMFQHQFEMQQRQMQQMYHGSPPRDSYQRPLQPGGPGSTSFDTSFSSGSEVPIPPSPMPGSHPYMMPIHGVAPPSPRMQQASRSESPGSPGKMNPQAATFDPSSGKFRQLPSI